MSAGQPDLSSPRPQQSGPQKAIVRNQAGAVASPTTVASPVVSERAPRLRIARWQRYLWTILAAASLGGTGWLLYHGSLIEEGHKNWKLVHAASAETQALTKSAFVLVDPSANKSVATAVRVGSHDADQETTDAMRQAYQANAAQPTVSLAEVQVLRQAQQIPAVATPLDGDPLIRQEPAAEVLNQAVRREIGAERQRFFHILLRDSCDEDGDVVEVLVDGREFAVVPLTNDGAMLSIPLRSGVSRTLKLKGIRDGAGGITVALRTSSGDYYCGVLQPGQECPLTVEVE